MDARPPGRAGPSPPGRHSDRDGSAGQAHGRGLPDHARHLPGVGARRRRVADGPLSSGPERSAENQNRRMDTTTAWAVLGRASLRLGSLSPEKQLTWAEGWETTRIE